MSLINKNCYHALALKLEDYVYSKCIEGLNLNGTKAFTFSIQFLPTASNRDVVLFKQEGAVEIGWRKGQYYYKTSKAYVTTEQGEFPFCENSWNQLDISCNNGVITFYMSGMEGTCEEIIGDATTSSTDYHIGEEFEGYIRYVRIINTCLSQKEIVSNQYKTIEVIDRLELYFDFTQFKEKDLGKTKLKILITGLSEVKDIVRALVLDESGIAIPSNAAQINPGGFSSKQFSIYQRIFLESGSKIDRVILGNGSKEKGIVIEVTADSYVKIWWNGISYLSNQPMELYKWTDLTIAYDSSILKIYYNGILDASYPLPEMPAPLVQGNLTIGNILMNGRPLSGQSFRGFMDMIAIFETAVDDKTLLKFAQGSPYIYETGLSALFFFHDNNACEELHSGIVTLSQGANLRFAENTLRIDKIEEIAYNIGDTKGKYTDFEIWEATSLAMAITAYIETQSSLKPTIDLIAGEPLRGGVVDRIIQDVLVKPEAQILLSNTSSISASEVGNLLKVLQNEGKLIPLLKSLYGTAAAFSLSALVETIGLSLLSEYGVFILGCLALCTLAALLVNKKQPEPPIPTPPSPPDPEKKYRYLQIKAIQFQMNENVKESAIPLAETTKKAIATPEWQCEKNKTMSTPSIEAYISSEVNNIKVEVTFLYDTNYIDTQTLYISAKSLGETVLGAVDEFDLEVSLPGIYKKTINLTQQKIQQTGIGKHKEQYNWSCKEIGFLGSTYHLTHLLPKMPIAPWSLKRDDIAQNITIGALEFFNTVNLFHKSTNDCVKANLETASRYVHYLLDSGRFSYPESADPQFSAFQDEDTNEITFDQDKFDEAEKGEGKIEVNCLDCNLIIVNMAALKGEKLTIVSLVSAGDSIKVTIHSKVIETPPFIWFKPTMLIGKKEWKALEDIDCHYVAAEGECDNLNALIYDGCLLGKGTLEQQIYAIGLVFTKEDAATAGASDDTTYRETFIGEGASCIIDQKYTFIHGTIQLEEKIGGNVRGAGSYLSSQIQYNSVFDDNGVITINSGGRFSFDSRITNYLKVGVNQNRCHSVSYDTICTCVSGPLNGYLKSGYTVKKTTDYFKKLIDVVFINGVISNVDDLFKKRALANVDEIEKILNGNLPAAITGTVMIKLIGYANTLISNLNNAISNLRLGNATWNQSVSSAFDAISWWYVNGAGKIIADNTTLHYITAQNVPVMYPPCTNKGFYITDDCDGRRLYEMVNNVNVDSTFCIYKAREVGYMDGYIYSSSNQYNIPNALANTDPIYFLYNGGWVMF